MRIELSPSDAELVGSIETFFRERGVMTWATGGFLRDALLGLPAYDVDITIDGDPLSLGRELGSALEGYFVVLDDERRHVRLVLPSGNRHIDLMPLRAAGIEADLRLRDFTINALAADARDLAAGDVELLDPTGGLEDLRAGVVRMTAEQCLVDDPLRLLRGVRIANQLRFNIEPSTAGAIQRLSNRISEAAEERQREEIMRLFGTDTAADGLRLLDRMGLFSHIFPEMDVTRGVEQPKEHHFDVFGHSIAAVGYLDLLMSGDPPAEAPGKDLWHALWSRLEWCEGLRDYFREEIVLGTPRVAVLKLCAMLHDIGKPETKTFEESGRMRFFGHGEAGAAIARRLMRRLRFSSRETTMVQRMIEAHLRPIQLGEQGLPTRRAIYRFFRDTEGAGIDTLFLSLGDHLGTVGPRLSMEGFRAHVALTSYILEMRFGEEQVVSPPKIVSGHELMAGLGLEPGPVIGMLLEAIREGQAAGEIHSREEALAKAKQQLAEERSAGRV